MNHFTGYELLWLFLIYSFLGWILETVIATVRQRKVVNRGLINGPFCIIYGIGAVVITVWLQELGGIWLFLFSAVYASIVEWLAGHLIQKTYHERWWDYSDIKWNLDGYICLPFSAIWGALGFIIVKWVNRILIDFFVICPQFLIHFIIWILVGMLAVDALASYILVRGTSKELDKWEETNNRFVYVSAKFAKWIATHVETRIHKAYPKAVKAKVLIKSESIFAEGCSFYKIVMLFFIGAFLGDITETIFCRITAGVWMSRSSVVWGPFSIVWGLAIGAVTALLYKYKDRSDSFLFMAGTLLGGAYEYLCSVFTEIVFGKVFWDYSKIPFNLGGRINLLYCFFWGIAAVVWFKKLLPVFEKGIEKIPMKAGKLVTWILIVFMSCNILMSCMALIRYDQRSNQIEAKNQIEVWLDKNYDDTTMQRIYPNAKETKATNEK